MIRRGTQSIEPYRFTADDYHRMVEAGILDEDDRVELLDGEILMMAPIGPGHGGCVNIFNARFSALGAERAVVAVQNPLRLGARSEPVPDLMLLKPRPDFYLHQLPRPDDVLLLVEVAESSLRKDRDIKLPLYAAAGIPEVWIADLKVHTIEGYTAPADGVYQQHATYRGDDRLAPQAFPDCVLRAGDLFGL